MEDNLFKISNYQYLQDYKNLTEQATSNTKLRVKEEFFNKNLAPSTKFDLIDDLKLFEGFDKIFEEDQQNKSTDFLISLDNPHQIGDQTDIDYEDLHFFTNTDHNPSTNENPSTENEKSNKDEAPQQDNKNSIKNILTEDQSNNITRPELNYEHLEYLFDQNEKKFLEETFQESCDMEILSLSLNALNLGGFTPDIKEFPNLQKFDIIQFNQEVKNYNGNIN